jgi:hypothetical protein
LAHFSHVDLSEGILPNHFQDFYKHHRTMTPIPSEFQSGASTWTWTQALLTFIATCLTLALGNGAKSWKAWVNKNKPVFLVRTKIRDASVMAWYSFVTQETGLARTVPAQSRFCSWIREKLGLHEMTPEEIEAASTTTAASRILTHWTTAATWVKTEYNCAKQTATTLITEWKQANKDL